LNRITEANMPSAAFGILFYWPKSEFVLLFPVDTFELVLSGQWEEEVLTPQSANVSAHRA